jgi:GT2 family glycosyltransferase
MPGAPDHAAPLRIAVVIPAQNEAAHLGRTLESLRAGGAADLVIVVDCASTDGTREVASEGKAMVLDGPHLTSRAEAMNAGALHALAAQPRVDAIWFVHADSLAPREWKTLIAGALADPRTLGGAFDFRWDYAGVWWLPRMLLFAIECINRVRFRITRSFFGDQGIFVRPAAFERVGGFPDVTLLEDVILCRQLRKHGKLRLARGRMITSPRRFLRHGVIRQGLLDLGLLVAERIGLRPEGIHAWYNREKG